MIIERTFLKTNKYTIPTLSYVIENCDDFRVKIILEMIENTLLDRYNIVIPYNYKYLTVLNRKIFDMGYEIIFDKLEKEVPRYIIYKIFKSSNVVNYFETVSIKHYRV